MKRLSLISILMLGFLVPGFAGSILISATEGDVGLTLPQMQPGSCETTQSTYNVPTIYFNKGSSGAAHFDFPSFDQMIRNTNCDTPDGLGSRYVANFFIKSRPQSGGAYNDVAQLVLTYNITFCPGGRTACDISYSCAVYPSLMGYTVFVGSNESESPPASSGSCRVEQAAFSIPPEFRATPDASLDSLMLFPYSLAISVVSPQS